MTTRDTGPQAGLQVTPVQIARLAGVGRAAVSNWRKRYPDFPRAMGGSATSPLFDLVEVEEWLRANDKLGGGLDPEERLWQRISADTDVRSVRGRILEILNFLATGDPDGLSRDMTAEVTAQLEARADAASRAELAERLVARLQAFERTGGGFTPTARLAEVIASLIPEPAPAHVVDPLCGFGDLLRALAPCLSGNPELVARDSSTVLVGITLARLELAGISAVRGEFDQAPGHATERERSADLVVSGAAMGSRTLKLDATTFDERWEFGVPPRSEPELAWLQHCFASVGADGALAMLMPSQASARGTGRKIRAELVRSGALHSVVALPPSLAELHHSVGLHLWILHRPARRRPDYHMVRLIDASGFDDASLDRAIGERWAHITADAHVAKEIHPVELLNDEMDLTPARLLEPPVLDVWEPVRRAHAEYVELLETLRRTTPSFERSAEVAVHAGARGASRALGELIRLGALQLLPAATPLEPDDIQVNQTTISSVQIAGREEAGQPSIGPVVRADPEQVDPYYLYTHLRSTANRHLMTAGTLGNRVELRRARIPSLPLEEQRALGVRLRSLIAFSLLSRRAHDLGEQLTALAVDGLATGQLDVADRLESSYQDGTDLQNTTLEVSGDITPKEDDRLA